MFNSIFKKKKDEKKTKSEDSSLSLEYLKKMDAYFRACNYLSAGQLYLVDNPLLKRKLTKEDVKKRIVGHWGTVPGQNFIYVHLNRIIKKYDLDMMYISGPGHGGNSLISNTYLEGSYSEIYPDVSEDLEGMKKLFKQFSFPGGTSSHVAPEVPGSINEGGELGYSLSHAFGSVFDNPNLITCCVVGDGEAETASLATSWHSNKFLNPKNDGVVLPILHLNGYKISNPTIFSRMSKDEIKKFFEGCSWKPYFVEGDDPMSMHLQMASVMDKVVRDIKKIKKNALEEELENENIKWPMIVLRTPKGWTGPKLVDHKNIEGTFRAHQVPLSMEGKDHLKLLEEWLKSYHPEELFDEEGKLLPELKELAPTGNKRMGSSPYANGGNLLKELKIPDVKKYAVEVKNHGDVEIQDMMNLGGFVRDIFKENDKNKNFRMFSPDEALSNRLNKVFEEENRSWNSALIENDEFLAKDGRIMDSFLSENMCQGWLEGYLLTGRHGFFHSYESFIRVVDSMASQHAKWLKITKELNWRKSISSLNYILTSNVWQQDHNGYTHQDPGFLNHLASKKSDIVRIYLPPDSNTLLATFDHVIRTKDEVNAIVASKHPRPQWLNIDDAITHFNEGIGIWDWASTSQDDCDIVLACAGSEPTLEALASVTIIKKYIPDIKIRFINVIDLMKLQSEDKHPHGLSDEDFDLLFTKYKPIIFNFHGYPDLIYSLLYSRFNRNIKVFGYSEEGSITTPFDMRVQNKIDRYHLVIEMVKSLPKYRKKATRIIGDMNKLLIKHKNYIEENGIDMEEIRDWKWQ